MFKEFKKKLKEEYQYSPSRKAYVRKELQHKDEWCYFSYKELLVWYIKRTLNLHRTK